MRLYFAGADDDVFNRALQEAGVGYGLTSYFKFHADSKRDPRKYNYESYQGAFLDSGAYSAFTKGTRIELSKYIEFIHQYKDLFQVYACLDVIGNPDATMKNQRKMEAAGLRPVVTFHQGSPFGLLRELVSEYDYIALGGMVGSSQVKLMRWLDQCFAIIRLDCRVHGFGYTSQKGLHRYPFFSVDSTSWLAGTKISQSTFFKEGRLVNIPNKVKTKATYQSIKMNDDQGQKYWRRRVIHNAREYQKFADYITKLWESRGVKWE